MNPFQRSTGNSLPYASTLLCCLLLLTFLFSNAQTGNFNTIRWSTVAPQPYWVNEAQAKVVNGKLYSFGGFDSRKTSFTPTRRAFVFDPVRNRWDSLAPLPFTPNGNATNQDFGGITHAGITTDGNNIFLAGGYTSNASGTGQIFGTNEVWRYNVATNSYDPLPPLPESMAAGQLEFVNGRLHYIGGTNPSRTMDLGTHYMLDLSNQSQGWQLLAPLPNPRHHGGSAVVNGIIYYIGGQHDHDAELVAQNDVHSYNPATNTWTQVADLPTPTNTTGRGHITSSVVVVNNRIIVLGGETVHNTSTTSMVSMYDPATNTWSNLNPLPSARFSGVAGFIGRSIYYSGGSRSAITYQGDLALNEHLDTFAVQADAYVRDGSFANTNYGLDTSLVIKQNASTSTGYTRRSFLRFPQINRSEIVKAKLRVYGRNIDNTGNTYITVKGITNDSWTETGINWSNAPAVPVGSESSNVITNTSAFYEFDVTNFVKSRASGNQAISFILLDTLKQNKLIGFNSKEFATNRPQLIVEASGTTQGTPAGTLLFNQTVQSVELEQGRTGSLLEYLAASNNTPVSATLLAADDKGDVPSWLRVNGNLLNNTPYTAGSEISFEINTTNLPVGEYRATVTAAAQGYNPATVNIYLTVRARVANNLANFRVNFQDSATRTPAGWLTDFGQAYGARTTAGQGSGMTYGWIGRSSRQPVSLVGNGRVRRTQTDTTLGTFMHMQADQITGTFNGVKVEGIWEALVANGTYDVTVSVGDNDFYDSRHTVNVEGVPAITNFVSNSTTRFTNATVTVSVSDGRLSLDAIGGNNTKINYVIISPSAASRPAVVRISPEGGSQFISENTSISTSVLHLPNGGIDNTTLTPANVFLRELPSGTIVPANVNGTGGGDAITLVPTTKLKLNTSYQFNISSNVKDLTGIAFVPYASTFTTTATPTGEMSSVSFTQVKMPAITGKHSSLQMGPDGKLYATTIDGLIKRFPVNTDGTLGTPEILYSLQDPDSTGPAPLTQQLAVGFTFDPKATASNLVAYVTHSSYTFLNGPNWDGKITRLSGAKLENVQPLVVGLPRSSKDHLTNSLAFGPDGALYLTQGSLSAMGSADATWNNRNEAMLSAAVLRLDLSKLPSTLPLNARTVADEGSYNPSAAGAPLTLYATGVRNAYDLVWHSNGELYVPTNGSAAGGNTPASVAGTIRPNGAPYSGPAIPALTNVQQTQRDYLFRVKQGGYYGHPNPRRGEYVLNGGNPTNGIDPAQVEAYPQGTLPDANYRGFSFDFNNNKSPNGAIEYKSRAFNGALKGKLLVVRYSQNDDIIALTPGVTEKDIVGFTEGTNIGGFSGFFDPLDLTEDTTTGHIYVSEYGGDGTITLLRASGVSPNDPTMGGALTVTPSRIVDNDVSGGSAGAPRNIIIKNTSNVPVRLASILAEGTNADQFALSNLPTFPRTINAGDSIVVSASFNPTSTGLKIGSINIRTVDSANVTARVAFRGLGTAGTGGSNEPSLQAILDLYEISTLVGDDQTSTNVINSVTTLQNAPLLGEELSIPAFVKAGAGAVTIEPLSVFGPTGSNPVLEMGWYPSGDSTKRTEMLTVSNNPVSSAQTVNVVFNGNLSFDPGNGSFGFFTRWPFFANRHVYSEDAFNRFSGAIPHHVRVYPFKQGKQVVPNKYVVAFEEHISGFDYQDFTFVVNNVAPANGINGGIVNIAPEADAFVRNGSYASANYGTDTSLVVKTTNTTSTGFNRNTYLKFQLGTVSQVTSARLRLYGRITDATTTTDLPVMGLENDNWSEETITWSNAPTTATAPINRINGITAEARYWEVDVTDFVRSQFNGDKVVSFLVSDLLATNRNFQFNSKEHPLFKPQLVINTAQPLNNGLFVENRDRFPSNDYYVASRIQIPWTRDTVAPFRYNANRDSARIRIYNKGIGTLVINSLTLSNRANWRFVNFANRSFDSTLLPLLINPGNFVDLDLQYVATNLSSTAPNMLTTDNLTIGSNDDKAPNKVLTLRGLWQQRGEDRWEPTAQTMINAFGYTTMVGFGSKDPNLGSPKFPKGNEVLLSYLVRADETKPVYVKQLGAYHGCCTQVEHFRWFPKGSPTVLNTLFTHIGSDAQTLQPRRGLFNTPAEGTFNPTTPFGFKVGGKDFTDTLLNPDRKIGIRVWVARDANGQVIPNSYIVANDYLGTSFTNFDYNDNMYFVSNVRPENGPSNASILVATPSAVNFETKEVQSTNNFTLTLRNSGRTYTAGTDPAIQLRGLTIVGENRHEFSATGLSKSTILAGETATVQISFTPASQGLKQADLLLYYNNASSPLRVPLYGIATNQGVKATVVNRIKSGSRRAMVISGKTWSADTLFAFDNLEPYKNVNVRTIEATEDDSVYLIEQSSNADRRPFRYEIPVPNGTYHARLHFAEIYWGVPGNGANGGAGSRVMTMTAEGQNRLINLDVHAEVGAAEALVKQVSPITVTDGRLNLNFSATANRPMICGIELYRFDSEGAVTPAIVPADIVSLPLDEAGGNDGTVRVFPNPVKDRLRVSLPENLEGPLTIQIVDVAGNVYPILNTRVIRSNPVLNLDISQFRFKKGVYFLKVIPDNKEPILTKLLVE